MSKHSDLYFMMELMNRMSSGDEEKKEKKEPPRQPEGYESFISDEEFEAIIGIKDAFEKFIDVHNSNATKVIFTSNAKSPYARIQYLVLSQVVEELQEAFSPIYSINALGKKAIDELAESEDLSVKDYENYLSKLLLMRKLLG